MLYAIYFCREYALYLIHDKLFPYVVFLQCCDNVSIVYDKCLSFPSRFI